MLLNKNKKKNSGLAKFDPKKCEIEKRKHQEFKNDVTPMGCTEGCWSGCIGFCKGFHT